MIVKLGTDSFGEQMKQNFLKYGISEEHILVTDQAASGVAPIAVDSSGYVIFSLPLHFFINFVTNKPLYIETTILLSSLERMTY